MTELSPQQEIGLHDDFGQHNWFEDWFKLNPVAKEVHPLIDIQS